MLARYTFVPLVLISHLCAAQVANDFCENAIPIICGSTTTGTTTDAQLDPATDCVTEISAPGVWYSFTGVEGTVVLSTCSAPGYDTKINVYTGECDDPQCITGNDDGPFGCFPGSEVILEASANVTYLVLVQGYDGETGDFTLTMTCATCTPPADLFATAADTQCLVYWTSEHVGAGFIIEYGDPGFTPGSGTIITGTIGVDGPPATISGLLPDTGYDVYLTEDCGGGDLSPRRGPVAFTTLAEPLAVNALCSGALPIGCGQSLSGNTEESLFIPGPACGSAYTEAPGLWYTFIGDGSEVTLSTCDQAAFDTKITAYSGTCSNPICAGGNDDALGCDGNTSALTFITEAGVEYRIIVHGYDGETGTFTLSMTCGAPCAPSPANDDCAAAEPLVPQPIGACVPVTGSNACAYASAWPNPPCDPFSVAADVWYSLNTGPSSDHTLTVGALTIGEFGVALYGSCDPASFVDCFDPQSGPITLAGLELETTYLIRIWNSGGAQAGTFTICDEAAVLTAINDGSAGDEVRVWPVPASGVLNIDGLPQDVRSLRLLDGQGRIVLEHWIKVNGPIGLQVQGLAPGAYVLRLDGGHQRFRRVILE